MSACVCLSLCVCLSVFICLSVFHALSVYPTVSHTGRVRPSVSVHSLMPFAMVLRHTQMKILFFFTLPLVSKRKNERRTEKIRHRSYRMRRVTRKYWLRSNFLFFTPAELGNLKRTSHSAMFRLVVISFDLIKFSIKMKKKSYLTDYTFL